MTQFQQRSHTANASLPAPGTRDAQRKAASQQLNQIAQRNNYRGYDGTQNSSRRGSHLNTEQRAAAREHFSEHHEFHRR